MKRQVLAILAVFVVTLATAAGAQDKKDVVVWSAGWFQARGQAFNNVVMLGPAAASSCQPTTLEEAVKCPDAAKATIIGDAFLPKGESFQCTFYRNGKLVVRYTDEKDRPKTKTFKIFDADWTTADQIR